jgi:hypothetical protein
MRFERKFTMSNFNYNTILQCILKERRKKRIYNTIIIEFIIILFIRLLMILVAYRFKDCSIFQNIC